MQIIDLFSGIGGFSLAGEWVGWRTVQFCEINPFGRKVLSHYWPDVPIHDDIKTLSGNQIINNGLYDKNEQTIITGGVPCQPWSTAGKRKGKADDRDLWEESIGIVKQVHPGWVLFENVRGLTNWNGGMVFDEVQANLEAEGYEVLPFLLPACAVNAPHRRDRIWFIAHSKGISWRNGTRNEGYGTQKISQERFDESVFITNTQSQQDKRRGSGRLHTEFTGVDAKGDASHSGSSGRIQNDKQHTSSKFKYAGPGWLRFPTQSPLCSGNDGLSSKLDGITFSKWRSESIRGAGNAIVPAVALQIFKAINHWVAKKEYER